MIAVLALLAVGDLSAARFFPLVPGTHWVYTDSESGTTIDQVVKAEVIQTPDNAENDPTIEHLPNYFPIEEKDDGQLSQITPCYVDKGNRVYLVGLGLNRPVSQRLVVLVSKDPYDWVFYGGAVSAIQTEAMKYECTSQLGPEVTVLGEKHDTVVVKYHETLGSKGNGIDMTQTWKYAADIGLYERHDVGRKGKTKIDDTVTLVKFEPGPKVVPGSKA